jgi:LuxR family maltose regulon positive regulatory protein
MGWLAALPEDVIRLRPWLCVFQAWILIVSGQGELIEARLRDAESAVKNTSLPVQEADRIQAYIAAIRAQVTFIQGAAPRTIEYAQFALSKLTSADETLRATSITILGAAQSFTGDFDAAIQSFEKAKKLSLAGGNHFNAMLALSALAQLAVTRGRLREAHRIYREGLGLVEKPGKPAPPGVGYAYVGLADVLREWNELESAADYAERGVALCKLIGQAEILMPGYVTLARLQRSRGDPEAALATLQEASRVASELSAWSLESVYVHLARLWLFKGELALAVQWMQQSGLGPDAPILFNREAALLTAVRVLMAQSRWVEADRLLERLAGAAEATGRLGSLVEILMLQGLSAWNQGEQVRALVPIERAVGLAEPEGYLRIFLDEGESMHALLAYCRKPSSKSTSYLDKLLAVFSGSKPTGATHPGSALVEPLSERELQVLRLLAAGRSNPEIAGNLYVSLNTVKAHVKSIFIKLEAHNRTEAINRARELQLI